MQWVEKWKGRVTSAELGALDAPIQVCVRKRPMSKLEVQKKALDVLTMSTAVRLYVHEPKVGLDQSHNVATQHFAFDKIFDEQAGNDFIYQSTLASAIPRLLEGENVSLFAYGATGSGKTHTVFGPDGGRSDGKTPADIGLYEYACAAVFDMIRDRPVDAFVSFLEIYSGRVYDLLNRRQPVTLLEQNGNFYFQGLQEYPAQSVADAQALMARGRLSRRTGSTEMNQTSSRSHAIFRIELRPKPDNDPATATDPKPTPSMLTLIDLAGSERGVDTPNSNSVLRREGAAINQSLLALKECIRALHVRAAYVPYRSAKLTCVLRECFTGQSRCFMVLNVAPASSAVEQTLGSLHYANRVKEYGHGGAVVGGGRDVRPEELLARLAAMSPVSSPDRGGAAFADDYTASFASDANGGHETDPISFVDEDGTGHGRDDGEEEVGGPADTSIVVDTSDDDDDAGPECEYADGYDYANAGLSLMSSTSFRSDNDDYENDETPAASRLTLDASGDTRSLPPLSDGSQQYSRLQMAGMRGAGVVQMTKAPISSTMPLGEQ
ncbi:P-loop containing nucleoside triphosphate hydrolase protein [Blastocladiella britannica]|nr:P-loop containing nucleoside triphosphate hydrolase protein [Blastocladiella britannica]